MKGAWVEELPCVLWSYRMTTHLDIKEMHFRLTFGQDTLILVEIGQASDHVFKYFKEANDQLWFEKLKFLEEDWEMAHI